jgi:serine/threonine protein kinase
MEKQAIKENNLMNNIRVERNIMKGSKSEFITRLYCLFRDYDHYYIVMEWAQGGDVNSFIKHGATRHHRFTHTGEIGIRFILGCVILGLEYLHRKNIAYWDLKPENLLVFEDGYIKLGDFGLSRVLEEG